MGPIKNSAPFMSRKMVPLTASGAFWFGSRIRHRHSARYETGEARHPPFVVGARPGKRGSETPTICRRCQARIGDGTDSDVTCAPFRIARMLEPRGGAAHGGTLSRHAPAIECARVVRRRLDASVAANSHQGRQGFVALRGRIESERRWPASGPAQFGLNRRGRGLPASERLNYRNATCAAALP